MIGDAALRIDALRVGAAAFLNEPLSLETLSEALDSLERLAAGTERKVALITVATEPDEALESLISGDGVALERIDPDTALEALRAGGYDLAVAVVAGRRAPAFAVLRELASDPALRELPVIAYLGGELSKPDRARLDALAKASVVSVADSPELLADRTALFLHRSEAQLPAATRTLLGRLRTGDAPLHGRKVLVIDDDIRNVFALTSTLEQRGMKVAFAENGREGIERLLQHPNTDVVLLDIMMPEMDGYETAAAIRAMPRFEHLPIISLTAKAMKGDREKAISAGASDYITKPVDVDQLVAMMRVWLEA
jgi:CheY-like chemotaxis protein